MLQRVQTIYLLLVSACMLIASVTPLASFFYEGNKVVFEAMGLYENGNLLNSTWGLFAIGTLSCVLALITVFLYKTRMLQIRITIFNMVLMLGFYLYFAFLVYRINPVELQFNKVGFGIITPAIAMILSYLAIRRIGADEVLVRSLDRLRG